MTPPVLPPVLSVIIVNWNGRDFIGGCLDSIAEAVLDLETEVIVVDNRSSDSSVAFVRERFPWVEVIENQANVGFGRGAQTGVEAARGEFVAVVNPDLVLGRGCLRDLVTWLQEHPRAAWSGPRAVQPDGVTHSGPLKLGTMFEPLRSIPGIAGLVASRAGAHDRPQRCEKLIGACMVFRASMLKAIGGMPTCSFVYGEEQVLGSRFRERGYEVWYVPHCSVVHERGSCITQRWTPDERRVTAQVGHSAAMRETLGYPRYLVYNSFLLLSLPLRFVAGMGRGGPGHQVTLRLMRLSAASFGPRRVMVDDGLKVVFASHGSTLDGGAERSLLEIAVALKRDGRVHPLVTVPREGPLAAALRAESIPATVLPTPWWARRDATGAARRFQVAHAIGRSVVPWARWLRDVRPDVVVTNTAVIPTPALACKPAGVPHVWWLHEFVTRDHGLSYVLGEPLSQRSVGRLSAVVMANSRAVRDHFSPPIAAHKTRVIYPGVEGFDATPNTVDPLGLRVLLLGRLTRAKGVALALEAASSLRDEGTTVLLRLVGPISATFKEELDRLVAALGIADSVEIRGATMAPQAEFAWANVVLMCSLEEAFGRVTVEALKSGRPVVGSRSGGTPELIREGMNGLLFSPGDPRELASVLRRLAKEPGLLAALSANASADVRDRFTIAEEVDRLVAVFETAVSRKSKAERSARGGGSR